MNELPNDFGNAVVSGAEPQETNDLLFEYTIGEDGQNRHIQYDISKATGLDPSYNIAPTNPALILYMVESPEGVDETYVLEKLKFGLVPSWAKPKDPIPVRQGQDNEGEKYSREISRYASRFFNCRRESLKEKAPQWNASKKHRCVIPITGYFEWLKAKSSKTPYYVHATNEKIIYLAGMYSHNFNYNEIKNNKDYLSSFTIITAPAVKTDTNDVSWLHDRKPVILTPRSKEWFAWLDPNKEWDDSLIDFALNSTTNAGSIKIEGYQVSDDVGKPMNKGEENIKRVKAKPSISEFFKKRLNKAEMKLEERGVKEEEPSGSGIKKEESDEKDIKKEEGADDSGVKKEEEEEEAPIRSVKKDLDDSGIKREEDDGHVKVGDADIKKQIYDRVLQLKTMDQQGKKSKGDNVVDEIGEAVQILNEEAAKFEDEVQEREPSEEEKGEEAPIRSIKKDIDDSDIKNEQGEGHVKLGDMGIEKEAYQGGFRLKVKEGRKSNVVDEIKEAVPILNEEAANFEDEIQQRETTEDVQEEEEPREEQEEEEEEEEEDDVGEENAGELEAEEGEDYENDEIDQEEMEAEEFDEGNENPDKEVVEEEEVKDLVDEATSGYDSNEEAEQEELPMKRSKQGGEENRQRKKSKSKATPRVAVNPRPSRKAKTLANERVKAEIPFI